MGKDSRIISSNASYGDEISARYLIASNGFEGETTGSSYSLSGSVSIKGEDSEARPESYWYDSAIFYDALIKKGIGTKALERTIRKLGQKKTASGKYRMVVDNMNSSRLLSPVISAIYGSSIQQKNSFMLDKLNQKVAGDKLTLTDEPHLPKSQGARYFDGEGVATRRLPVFEDGVLKTYYIDVYNANKLQTAPTIGSPSILAMKTGDKDVDGLVSLVEKGILVTGFNGGNCNSSTGDFSYGVEGFLIENGKLTQPVSEMNVTGNMLTLWSSLAEVGKDIRNSSSWKIPSLLFDDVDFSGL
jgi:PmbA protein